MNLYEVAWTIATMVSRKEPGAFKLTMDRRVPYPLVQYIGRPVSEHILHIPTPEKLVPNETGLSPLNMVRFRVFRACAAHEACHVYLTNPLIYEAPQLNSSLSSFVANLIEDYRVETFLASKWAGLGRDVAFANAVAYLRLHPVDHITQRHKRILLAAVMQTFCGKIKGDLPEEERVNVQKICDVLKSIRWASDATSLVEAVLEIRGLASSEQVHSGANLVLPHHDGKRGGEYYRYVSKYVSPDDFDALLKHIADHMDLEADFVSTNKDDLAEAENIFHDEEMLAKSLTRIEGKFKIDRTKFRYIGFSPRDYSEYLRIREKVNPLLKSLENQLAMISTEIAEIPGQPRGILDLTEAIQSIASENPKTRVFSSWETAARGGAWAILLDNSLSMTKSKYTIREIAIIFGQVLKNLCPEANWGLYAFSDTFLVLKDFDEKYNKNVAARLGGITCGGATFLPDAIEVVYTRLAPLPQSSKVIVVVSDGEPQGYPGIEDATKQMMKRVANSGVVAIGIGLNYRGMQRYFRNWCYVNRIQDLPRKFILQYYALVGIT